MKKKIFFALLAVVTVLACLALPIIASGEVGEASPKPCTETLNIVSTNLSFRDSVCIKFAVDSNNENTKLLVWNEESGNILTKDGLKYGTQTATLSPVAYGIIDGVKYLIFDYTDLKAKQMTENVYVCAYLDGQYGEPMKYSILQYAYDALKVETDQKYINLINATLAQGAAAQEYFEYKTDRLANAQYYQIKVVGGTLSDGFNEGLYKEGDQVTVTAPETDANGTPFDFWSDDIDSYISTDREYTFTVGTEDKKYVSIYDCPFTRGLSFIEINDGTEYAVSGMGTATDTDIVIPRSYNGKRVTAIANSAFMNHTGIKSITVPDGVTSIGDYAFSSCTGIESITLPQGVTSIGNFAFCYCAGLAEIIIPESVTGIGEYAFYNCQKLTELTVPGSVTSIENNAFENCSSLTRIKLPYGITEIGYCVFLGCSSLGEIQIPSGVTRIAEHAFSSCVSLSKVTFSISSELTSIGDNAFSNCTSLSSITIPTGVVDIGEGAFRDCSSIRRLVLPSGIKAIENFTFDRCQMLESVTVPVGVTSIGVNAFISCSELKRINFGGTVAQWNVIPKDGKWNESTGDYAVVCTDAVIDKNGNDISDTYIKYTEGLSYTLINGDTEYRVSGMRGIKDKNIIIPPTFEGKPVTEIGNRAFVYSDITSVVIPDSVRVIDEMAFDICKSLTSVVIPYGVESIGTSAFESCSSLVDVTIPCSVKSIGEGAFELCTSLTSITIPDGTEKIYSEAFLGCSSLTSIRLSKSVEYIGREVFRACTSVTSITVDEGNPIYHSKDNCLIKTAEKTLILGCDNSIIPSDGSVTSIGDYAFYKCGTITSVTLPSCVTSIGNYAFYKCSSLTSIVIPDGVTNIGDCAYAYCTSLTSVTIPDSVKSIGGSAFTICSNLTDIFFQGTEEQWNAVIKGESWDYGTATYTLHFLGDTPAAE